MIQRRFRILCMAKQPKAGKKAPVTQSLSYPYYGFAKCILLAEGVFNYAGLRGEAPKSVIAAAAGMSEASSTLSQLIGSAKMFGMIQGNRNYSLTDGSARYFHPQTDSDKRDAELEFLNTPSAYTFLIRRFDGTRLPDTDTIAKILKLEAHVSSSWATRAASIFVTTAEEMRVIDSARYLRYNAAQHSAGNDRPPPPAAGDGDPNRGNPIDAQPPRRDTPPPPPGSKTNVWVYSETEGEGSVRLETPLLLPHPLWVRLTAYVKMLEPGKPAGGPT